MALTAEIISVPINDKHIGHGHLPGRTIKIFANRLWLTAYAVRRRNSVTKRFRNLQLVDLGCLKDPRSGGDFL